MRLSRRTFLKDIGLTAAAIGTVSIDGCKTPSGRAGNGKRKPNIIYILADDLGHGDLGCFGQRKIKTPNLDKMAAEGMKFTQHYAGSTVCAPSRCSLMTGKHTGHCTVRGNVDVLMKPDEITIAKTLKQAGYSTACIGKWGIGHPPPPDDPHNNGFDHFFGYLSMWHAHNFYPDFLWKDGKKAPLRNVVQHPEKHYKADQEELVGLASEKLDYSHDLFSQAALEFIEEQDGPFFLFVPYTIPHANNEAGQFGEHGMEVPDYGIYADKDWPEPEKGKAAMISRLDRDIGKICAKLKQLGIDEEDLRDLDIIIEETNRVRKIVWELLDFARQSPANKEDLDINEILQQLVSLIAKQKEFRSIRFIQNYDNGLQSFQADKNHIQQVFLNFLLNSAESITKEGTIDLSTHGANDHFSITITDTGCGIKSGELDRIFDPFYTTKPVGKGTGLGLSVSYGLVKQYGGEIQCESKEGEGTTFTVTFPYYYSGDNNSSP